MLKMVDGTGIIGVDMVCPLGGAVSPPQPPNFDKIEMEGVGSLMLPNSLKAPLERVELTGNSVQGENPAPDNPQEIESAGRFDEASGKYLLDVKVTGENLLDMADIQNENGKIDSDFSKAKSIKPFKVIKDRKYLLISKGTMIVDVRYSSIYFGEDDLAYGQDSSRKLTTGTGYSCFIGTETRKILVAKETCTITKTMMHGTRTEKDAYEVEELGLFEIINDNPNIDYEPYTEQTVQIALDEPLRGIGEYKDTITKDGAVRKIKRAVFDGSEDEKWGLSREHENHINFALVIKGAITVNTGIRTMMDKFKYFGAIWNSDLLGQDMFGATLRINMPKTLATDLQTFKTWLSQNPLTVDYVLAEPVTEPLQESVQQQLQALHSENGTTHVFVDSGEVPCGIKLTYRKEI